MRDPHASRYRPSIGARIKYRVLTAWPLRWWWRLPAKTREWWVRESQMRHGWTPAGRMK